MAFSFKRLFSLTALKHIYIVPKAIIQIKNWIPFLLNYIRITNTKQNYIFRNGLTIYTNEGVDSSTVAVVFLKNEYGVSHKTDTIIDIGANIGVYSLISAKKYKSKVYAYEPMPQSFSLLKKNIELNKLQSKVKYHKLAVAKTNEKRRFYNTGSSPFNSLYTKGKDYVEVECTTLKDIFKDNNIKTCDILKIDCEGAEYEILYNTPDSILAKIKEIRMEYHKIEGGEKDNVNDLKKYLQDKGFSVTKWDPENEKYGMVWFKNI